MTPAFTEKPMSPNENTAQHGHEEVHSAELENYLLSNHFLLYFVSLKNS